MSRLLTLQDDNDDLKFVGNAFPIDPVPQNIALLTCISWRLLMLTCLCSELEL